MKEKEEGVKRLLVVIEGLRESRDTSEWRYGRMQAGVGEDAREEPREISSRALFQRQDGLDHYYKMGGYG